MQQNIIHPRSGTWEIVGFGKSIVRLDDIQNQNQYTNQNARIQLFFGDDGNIYNINHYSNIPYLLWYKYKYKWNN